MQDSISRRGFLTRSGQLLAALAPGATMLGGPAWAGQRDTPGKKKPYYVLQPEWNNSRDCNLAERAKGSDCHGCKACHNHAKNKLFATRRAADRNRAHPFCKCKVIRGGSLDPESWVALFGGFPATLVVDKRTRGTKRLLRQARRRARQG